MSRRSRQQLDVFRDESHGPVTRSQTRSQLQKGKQSTIVQPLQIVQNVRHKGRNSVGGKRKTRAQPKKLEDEPPKRRVSRALADRENAENVPHAHNYHHNAQQNASAANRAPSLNSSRRDSVVDMVDEVSWSDQAIPMSTVKSGPQSPPKPPCDIKHKDDDLHFVPYVEEIFSYLRVRENEFRPNVHYMDAQNDINDRMRSILVNWLVEVHEKFRLRSSTLYLTISIVDRFLSRCQVTRSKLQLVGCVAMLLASKFEEIYPPEVQDFVYIADSAYSREEILQMEGTVIRTLRWDMSVVTPHCFTKRFLDLCEADEWEQIYTNFIMELALIEYRMIKYKPSELAAAAVYLALKFSPARQGQTSEQLWGEFHERHTKYSRAMLKDCMRELLDCVMKKNPKEKAVRKKYAKDERRKVSTLSVRMLMKGSTAVQE